MDEVYASRLYAETRQTRRLKTAALRHGVFSNIRSAVNWWLRNPNTSNSNNEYNVNTSGAQNNNNANNSNGFVPDCLTDMQEELLHEESTRCGNECKEICVSKMQGRTLSWPQPNMQGDAQAAENVYSTQPAALTTPNKHMPQSSSSFFLDKLTIQMLADAAKKCANGVRWKSSVSTWMFNVWINCAKLRRQILEGTYRLSKYVIFMIYDKKPRKIHSTKFQTAWSREPCAITGCWKT